MRVRLNKYIADCTGISRRKADELIIEGKVLVNGRTATVGQTVTAVKDKILLNGKEIYPQKRLYIMFNKPSGYITTRSDPEGRPTIYDILPDKYRHLDPVGRLDRNSSGLLLMSNDGSFVQEMSHPSFEHEKAYRVKVNKTLTPEILGQLEKGIILNPENKLAIAKIKNITDKKTVTLALKTGMNRQIRRCFEFLGYEIINLKRVAFGGLTLGKLPPGKTRELKPWEIRLLRKH